MEGPGIEQIGVARYGAKSIDLGDRREQHLSGIRLSYDSTIPEKPPTNLQFEPAVSQSTLVGV